MRVSDAAYLIEDESLGVLVVPIGGRGEADASGGEPPDYYVVVERGKNDSLFGLRYLGFEMAGHEVGYALIYNIESVFSEDVIDLSVLGEAVLAYKRSLYERIGRKPRTVEVKLVENGNFG